MSFIGLLHDLHDQHVLVDRDTGFSVNAGDFELIDSHFVMSSFEGNSDLKEFLLNFFKSLLYCAGHPSIVVLTELLIAARVCADHSSSQPLEVFSLIIGLSGNNKILLF